MRRAVLALVATALVAAEIAAAAIAIAALAVAAAAKFLRPVIVAIASLAIGVLAARAFGTLAARATVAAGVRRRCCAVSGRGGRSCGLGRGALTRLVAE